MKTLSYILGFSIIEHSYVIVVSAMFFLVCIFVLFACYILEKGNEKRTFLVYIVAFLSLALFVWSFYLIAKGEQEMKEKSPPVEENGGNEEHEHIDDVYHQHVTCNKIYHVQLQLIEDQ